MYKVFIENSPIFFHFNSQSTVLFEPSAIWEKINLFLKNEDDSLHIDLKNEEEFNQVFESHKYIEAAGGMVKRGEAYLFIKRNGIWDIPKGKLEKDETPEIAAVREIEEECGLIEPNIVRHLLNTWHTYPHKGRNILKRTYWYLLNEGDKKTVLVPQSEEGITEVKYILPAEFEEVKSNTYLSIIDVIEAL